MKLRCAVLLRLGLKGVKIFWNVSKFCMHTCRSNLNSENLLERETPSCGFNSVGLRGGQNSLKHPESWRACLSIQYASKHMIRVKFYKIWSKLRLHHAVLLGFGLKMAKIALNIVNVGMHCYFPNAGLNL